MSRGGEKTNLSNFEIFWDELPEKDKVALIETALKNRLEESILPAFKGLYASNFAVRTQAKKALAFIRSRLAKMLKDPSDTKRYDEGMRSSAKLSALFFTRLFPNIAAKEHAFAFKLLLGMDGLGAHFAFNAFVQKKIDPKTAISVVMALPDFKRLAFIGEYLKAKPERRLKFAPYFKRLIRSVNDQDAVVRFYANLFDAQQDADPFLLNLDARLRDHRSIIENYVNSPSSEVRCLGLKALAMISTRLPAAVIKKMLASETDIAVRQTVYQIIEHSALGSYSDIFQALLQHIEKAGEEEAFYAFKALIVTGRKPLHEILDIVTQQHPGLKGHIYEEISQLSKISFYFLQDMALNPSVYIEKHVEINLAAIFGIIKKRPERVVKWIKDFDGDLDENTANQLNAFITRTNQLFKKEKKNMLTPFYRAGQQAKKQPEKPDGFLNSLFSTNTLPKKIEALKSGKTKPVPNFENELIADADLCDIQCSKAPVNFNAAVLNNCKMEDALFFNTYFKGSIFSNVDMTSAVFENVCFSDAVFINVDASRAVFKNCEFINISMLNCNFNGADLTHAAFICATISKCTFQNTRLEGAAFCFSDMSLVSIEDAMIEQGDFSGLKARFCRFPVQVRSDITDLSIDLNARKFQLEVDDMPQLDSRLIRHVNMLIFGEFIHYGENKFIRQNKHSLLTALDMFKPKQADLFSIIPLLLHVNLKLPAYKLNFNPDTPCGIHGFHPSPETLEIFGRYSNVPTENQIRNTPLIEGLFTIGSIGSVAQTEDSDIDYWVCVVEKKLGKNGIQKLRQKFELIEKFAFNQFRIQVTFFLVDVEKACKNDFGDSTIESSGSAQAMLLKEEFYRTMIHIAGKVPLWALLPSAVSKNYYDRIKVLISSFPGLIRYIDLGDIHRISPDEFFGATIWQLFKSLKSPFKSVIKIALLEKYISEAGKKPLLCNSVKDEWMNSGVNLKIAQSDPYYILLKNLLAFYAQSYDHDAINLILTCFYLKLTITDIEKIEDTVFGLRQVLIVKCLDEWKISPQNLTKFGNYKNWPYKGLTRLTGKIESFLINKYRVVNNAFGSADKKEAQISPEDRTVLGRKVYAELSRKKNKLSRNLLLSGYAISFDNLQLEYEAPPNQEPVWKLTSKRGKNQPPDILMVSNSIEKIGAWLILNDLYSKKSIIGLRPNPTAVTADDLKKMLDGLYTYFRPAIKKSIPFRQLLQKEEIKHLFISFNFYAPKQSKKIIDYTVIYLTSWGELFAVSGQHPAGFENLKTALPEICSKMRVKSLPSSSVYAFRGKIRAVYP